MATRKTSRDRHVTLCFHGVGVPGRELEEGEGHCWVGHRQFIEILEAVSAHPRPVEITFDDSNESDFTVAMPELRRLGLTAEFFVIAGRVDSPGSLTPTQITGLKDAGMAIGTHGMWHKRWPLLRSDDERREEILGAAEILANIVGEPIRHAACPNGSYNRRVLADLKRAGYTRVYSVDGGSSRPSSWLRSRYTVHSGDSGDTIRALLDRPDGDPAEHLVRATKILVKKWR